MANKISTSYTLKDRLTPYLLLIPALGIAAIVLVYPLINGISLSMTNYSLITGTKDFVGLENFLRLFRSEDYWKVFFNSIFLVFSSVFAQFLCGLFFALLLNRKIKGRNFYRGLLFSIWIVPEIVVALLWMIIYNSDFGILNYVLSSIGIIKNPIKWLAFPTSARYALIIVYAWRGIPFFMVMILAALQTVPTTIVEAATIDGAHAVQRFFAITVPYIRDILLLSCLLSVVRLFQDVTQILTLTNGGPVNATTTLAIDVYKKAFTRYQMGEAAAVGVTWLLFLMIFATYYIHLVTKRENDL
jgi:multiple sugar transport system permease protein